MNWKRKLPNLLTIFRIIATFLLGLQVFFTFDFTEKLPAILGLTGCVYVSDVLDGFLARKWNCCSVWGEKADISADLLYIISQDVFLIWRGRMHAGVLLLVIGEFLVFALTSRLHSHKTCGKEVWFDKAGRLTAGYYYLMPLLYLLISLQGKSNLLVAANLLCLILTVAAVLNRLSILVKPKTSSANSMSEKQVFLDPNCKTF